MTFQYSELIHLKLHQKLNRYYNKAIILMAEIPLQTMKKDRPTLA